MDNVISPGDRVFWGKSRKFFGTVILIDEDDIWVHEDWSSEDLCICISDSDLEVLPEPFNRVHGYDFENYKVE